MNTTAKGVVLKWGRNSMRAKFLVLASLFTALASASSAARADNGALYVAPGPTTIISADLIRRNQEQLDGSARKLGDLLGNSLRSPSQATDLVVTTKCGRYQSATITYADGSAKTLNLSNAPASQKDMDRAKAAIPILRFIDIGGCDK